ncbi:MAG: hypothetical protein QM601_09095 [Pseudoxanthomonas sp.]
MRTPRSRFAPALLTLALAAAPALAQQSIDKVNGSISAEPGQAYGSLETVNGSIRIGSGASTGDASTVNGAIAVGDRATTGGLETVNGGIKAGREVTVHEGVETVNGSIFFDRGGRIGKDVETVNGGIGLVATQVGGDVETVSGDITVGVDSHVRGGIKVEKNKSWIQFKPQRDPRIVIGPNAVVEGALVFERPVKLYVHSSARIGPVTGATAVPFSTPTAPQD